MSNTPISFEILKHQPGTLSRAGVLHTPHGDIETPAFVPVGTNAAVRSIKPEDMKQYIGNQVALANTYHLYLQPGHEVVKESGGLHSFANWHMPTITDSGGFQIFSLGFGLGEGVTKFMHDTDEKAYTEELSVYSEETATQHGKLCVIDEEGATFTSHRDGSLHRFTAERSMEIQHALGADIIFAFDECPPANASREYEVEAMGRTHRWAKRSILAHKQNYEALKKQALYGVVQGGRYADLREESAKTIAAMDFDGFGIGGSFSKAALGEPIEVANKQLPPEKPRHLLGIGEPEDIEIGVAMGCDTFDCILPTRLARHGVAYTKCHDGYKKINLFNSQYTRDFSLLDEHCDCIVCMKYTKAYIAHLFKSKEILGPHLLTLHNLNFFVNFTKRLRERILSS